MKEVFFVVEEALEGDLLQRLLEKILLPKPKHFGG